MLYYQNINYCIFLGQLNKFTNVVKGWQYRWFVLTPETGNLDYYLMDEGIIGKRRGKQHVAGTMVVPSDEDSQTFQVNFASGESYKLRAANVKDRQIWVDRIRAVAQRHESAMARDQVPPIGSYLKNIKVSASFRKNHTHRQSLDF